MGKTGVLVVLQFSGGVWKHGLSATWVAWLFLASLLLYCHWLYALVSIIAHFLRINVDFALYRENQGRSALIREIAMASVWELVSLPKSKFLWHVHCFLLFCGGHSAQLLCHCSCSCSSMWNLVCRVNRGAENNTSKREKFHPSVALLFLPVARLYPPLVVLYLWPKCFGVKSYYFLVNKPVSGRNYTQLCVRSFSEGGLDPFI